jgi:pyridoxine 4-dehydrogenase
MSSTPTPELGGKAIGNQGYGLMGLTWRSNPQPLEDSIAVMKSALNKGANFWNGGILYGTKEYNSEQLLNAYFTKYPEDAAKVVICIKGGFDASKYAPDASPAFLRKEVEALAKSAEGKWKIDIFEAARVDPNVPIEETVKALAELVKEGKIGGVGLSECSAQTIRRAAKVTKIESVEVEFSLFSTGGSSLSNHLNCTALLTQYQIF